MLGESEMELLVLLLEDDYGLWEVGWRLRDDGSGRDAVDAVEFLCGNGLAEIWVREWIDAEPVPVARSGRQVDLQDPRWWREPATGEAQILVSATLAGHDAVRALSEEK